MSAYKGVEGAKTVAMCCYYFTPNGVICRYCDIPKYKIIIRATIDHGDLSFSNVDHADI